MSVSINTNHGARTALAGLARSNRELAEVQSRINSGLKVGGARDNGAIYAMAQTHRSELSGYDVVARSLDRAISITEVALGAVEAISDLLIEMNEKALAATDASLSSASRTALNEDFTVLRDQMETIVQNAEFSGVNLINGTTNGVFPLTGPGGAQDINVYDYPMQFGGSHSWIPSTQEISTVTEAQTAMTRIGTAQNGQLIIMRAFGSWLKSMEITRNLTVGRSDLLTKNLGSLVDADLAKEGARLQAVQTRQQLGVQALNIANQAPNIALSLFDR